MNEPTDKPIVSGNTPKKPTPVEELTGLRITNKRRKHLLRSREKVVSQGRPPQDYLQKYYRKAKTFSLKRLSKIARRLVQAVDQVPHQYQEWKADLEKEGITIDPREWPGRPEALLYYNLLAATQAVLKDRAIEIPERVAEIAGTKLDDIIAAASHE